MRTINRRLPRAKAEEIPPFTGVVSIIFAADPGLRENARLVKSNRSRRLISSNEYRTAKANLTRMMFVEWRDFRFAPKVRTRVEIMYYRTGFRDDPSGYVKAILDSVAEAINVDDRYFSHSVDYQATKEQPRFRVTVTQA